MSDLASQTPPELDRLQMPLLGVGVAALALCVVAASLTRDGFTPFLRSYLLAYVFWIGIALGSLAILMMQYLTGGAWGIILRRALEASTRTLPLLALMFLPLLFGMNKLYVWTDRAIFADDPLLQRKSGYLTTPFFIVRAVSYFVVWIALSFFLNRWSAQQDQTAAPPLALKLQRLSGPGLFVLAVTLTLALVDWVMSLEPRWYSTIYAVIYMTGAMLAAFALTIGVVLLLARRPPLADVIGIARFFNFGNLLLAFVMLWAYCAFAQYLLIWSGNLREEIPWYLHRNAGGWGWVSISLVGFHFALPFFLLLSRDIKRHLRTLVLVAAVVLLARFVDMYWLIEPAFHPADFSFRWMDFVAPIGVGGVWAWMFVRQLRARPLLPLNDPYAEEAFAHESN